MGGFHNSSAAPGAVLEVGQLVTLTFRVKNAGNKVSGPVAGVMFGCISTAGCTHADEYYGPDRFTLIGCAPSCRAQTVNDRTTWYMGWSGKIKPGQSVKLTVTFRAKDAAANNRSDGLGTLGYNYISGGLYAASIAEVDAAGPNSNTHLELIEQWPEIQIVVFPKDILK